MSGYQSEEFTGDHRQYDASMASFDCHDQVNFLLQ